MKRNSKTISKRVKDALDNLKELKVSQTNLPITLIKFDPGQINDHIVCVNVLQQGVREFDRVGRKVQLRKFLMDIHMYHQVYPRTVNGAECFLGGTVIIRLVYCRRAPPATSLRWTDFFKYDAHGGTSYATTFAPLKLSQRENCTILKEWIRTTNPASQLISYSWDGTTANEKLFFLESDHHIKDEVDLTGLETDFDTPTPTNSDGIAEGALFLMTLTSDQNNTFFHRKAYGEASTSQSVATVEYQDA